MGGVRRGRYPDESRLTGCSCHRSATARHHPRPPAARSEVARSEGRNSSAAPAVSHGLPRAGGRAGAAREGTVPARWSQLVHGRPRAARLSRCRRQATRQRAGSGGSGRRATDVIVQGGTCPSPLAEQSSASLPPPRVSRAAATDKAGPERLPADDSTSRQDTPLPKEVKVSGAAPSRNQTHVARRGEPRAKTRTILPASAHRLTGSLLLRKT